ncbi:MAG: hypothetical protein AAFV98_07900 [Chloroflexota bacterium]
MSEPNPNESSDFSTDLPPADAEATQPTPVPPVPALPIWTWLKLESDTWFARLFVPFLVLIQLIYTSAQLVTGDFFLAVMSLVSVFLMILFAGFRPLQELILRRPFTRSHAFYIMVFWVTGQLFVFFYRIVGQVPSLGKDSEPFYVFLLIFAAVTFRMLMSLYGLTPYGYRLFASENPLWEQILVALNEFISVSLFSFVLGRLIARIIQPDVFTLQTNFYYNIGLLFVTGIYYLLLQAMWIGAWNRWLSRNTVWVRLARLIAPILLVVASLVIARHFANLSEPRTANLLGDATVDETILSLSPIIWMMVFYVVIIVYSGGRGLRRMLIPNRLLNHLPEGAARPLRTISDMDILLIFGLFVTVIPVQLFLFNDTTIIGDLQAQIQGNALIDSSEQALAFIFGLPFYIVALSLLVLYAFVMANTTISAHDRDTLVDRLPVTLIVIFIITLYLAVIPFSEVLVSGSIPDLQSDLGYILAFNVLIPLVLFYGHYYLLIRFPYGRGQTRWRVQHGAELESRLRAVDTQLANLQKDIDQCEFVWKNRGNLQTTKDDQIGMLFDLIELNGKRDRLNMQRLQILSDRQALQDVSESPISLTVASMPTRIIQLGIPLVLIFKVYEWAIVNDGLREVASNPNIGVIEFFQIVLESTNF